MVYIKLLRFLCGRVDFLMHIIGIFAYDRHIWWYGKKQKKWQNLGWKTISVRKKENKYTYLILRYACVTNHQPDISAFKLLTGGGEAVHSAHLIMRIGQQFATATAVSTDTSAHCTMMAGFWSFLSWSSDFLK